MADNLLAVQKNLLTPNFGVGVDWREFAPSALYLLAAPSTPKAVRQEAIERAQAGEPITYSTAREMVQEYRQRGFMVAFRVAI